MNIKHWQRLARTALDTQDIAIMLERAYKRGWDDRAEEWWRAVDKEFEKQYDR